MQIESFRADLIRLTSSEMYNRYVLTGSCAALQDSVVHAIRSSVSSQFSVDYTGVIIVGSSNLGFSIKQRKRYVPFGEDSDIDVAIVCPNLFERVWHEVFLYEKSGAYWNCKGGFRKYLSKGWIRPDLLPASNIFSFSNDWWEYFQGLRIEGCPYKITGGIYHSQFFLSEYQTICIEQCKSEL
jgi:hypothetical protein